MAEVTKRGKSRKALKPLSANEINISAGKSCSGLSLLLSPNNNKARSSVTNVKADAVSLVAERSLAEELKEVQMRMEKLRIEKEKTEEMLKERDETIRMREEELESRNKEHEKMQKEIKKLQKMKEFRPTMNFPLVKSLREKEQEKNDKKKKKDCPERKRPAPAYILWSKDQWNELKKENPNVDFKETANLLGAKWKNLSAEDKKPYEEKYQQEKEAYLQIVGQEKREHEAMKLLEEEQMQKTAMELLEQYLQFKEEANKDCKKVRKEKDPLKPKKPMSAFFLYMRERRPELIAESKSTVEISKIAGEEWKSMAKEEKASYEELAKKQMEDYNKEIELYKQKKIDDAANIEKEEEEQRKFVKQEALQLLKKKEKTENIIKKTKETRQKKKKGNADPNKPKKPASGFLLFSNETRKEVKQEQPAIGFSAMSAVISVKWKELSEAEKKIWNEKAAPAMVAYKKEMEEYNKLVAASGISTTN